MSLPITPHHAFSGLPQALLQANLFDVQQLEVIKRQSQTQKIPFIEALLKNNLINSATLAEFCSKTFSCPLLDLSVINVQSLPDKLVDGRTMKNQQVVVLSKRDNKLSVAIADPTQTQALDQIKFQTGLAIEPIVVSHKQLMELISRLGQSAEQNLNELIGDDLDQTALINDIEIINEKNDSNAEIDDAPVVRFLQKY